MDDPIAYSLLGVVGYDAPADNPREIVVEQGEKATRLYRACIWPEVSAGISGT